MCFSHLSCFCGRLIKGHFKELAKREIPVDLNFCCILTMEKVHTASTASDGAMQRLFDEFDKAKDVLGKARNQIHEGFEELREDQDTLAAENGVLDFDGSEILDINAGGVIMSVTRDTLTLIKGTRLEALFSGRWDKHLPRDSDGRVFLDVNPKCFE